MRHYLAPSARRIGAPSRGFSLMEILIVITIIGLIMAWAATNIFGKQDQAQARLAKGKMSGLTGALDMYKLDTGRYPNSSEGLKALLTSNGATNWNGPYVKNADEIKDVWRNDYIYRSPGESSRPFELISLGADGKEGGDGPNKDINSWE